MLFLTEAMFLLQTPANSSSISPVFTWLFLLLLYHLFVPSLFCLHLLTILCIAPDVLRHPDQSHGALRFIASAGCGVSRREGQGGVGEGAGGGEEERPQAHRNSKIETILEENSSIKME